MQPHVCLTTLHVWDVKEQLTAVTVVRTPLKTLSRPAPMAAWTFSANTLIS